MVSYSKSSLILFLASSIGGANAHGHHRLKNFDREKFAAEIKDLRLNGPGSENYKAKMQKGSEEGQLRGSSALEQKGKGKGKGKASGGKKSKGKGKGGVTSEFGNIEPGCTTSPDCFLDGHEFRSLEGDSRGPCPFINVMANHGFLNRNGLDTIAFNIPLLAEILFDLPAPNFDPIVNLAIFDGQAVKNEDGEILMDIERLWDRPGEERDMSQIFPNPGMKFTSANMFQIAPNGDAVINEFPPPANSFPVNGDQAFLDFRYNINEDQLIDLLSRTTADGYLTTGIHTEFLIDRFEDSLNGFDKDAPEGAEEDDCMNGCNFASSYFRFSEEDTHVTSNQFNFPVFLLNEDIEDFTFAPASHIEGLWREFRFPEGYAPHSVRFGDAFDAECYEAERVRLATINEWTIKKIIMEDNMKKAGASEETIAKALAEVDLPTNEAVPAEFRANPFRAEECAPLGEGMASPKTSPKLALA